MSTWDMEIHGGVAVLTFNRPPNNWMNLALDDGLALEADLFRNINASAAAQSRNATVRRP